MGLDETALSTAKSGKLKQNKNVNKYRIYPPSIFQLIRLLANAFPGPLAALHLLVITGPYELQLLSRRFQ